MNARPIRNLRWYIGGLLFASTVINYIDRQTLSVLAPILKAEYRWSNTDFASVLIAFRIAYTIMQGVGGRLLDLLGTRRGLALSVAFYSLITCLTCTMRGLGDLRVFRFLLGASEAPNMPGGAKTVAEWFPAKERAWAVAGFDAGTSIGGAVAPFVVLFLYHSFGSWRPAFLFTGSLGVLWLIAWWWLYESPERHPRITPEELEYIQRHRSATANIGAPRSTTPGRAEPVNWFALLGYRQTWGIVLGRFLLDPYWFFVAEWFALYLKSKGFSVEQSILGFWMPFLASDVGNFFGGGLSSWFIKRGWPVGRSRRTVLGIFGPSMLVLIFAVYTSNYFALIALFSYATFAYSACSTMFLSLPADVFHPRAVGSVAGLGGTGAGIGTLITTLLIGIVSDRMSFTPVVIAASIIPCVATCVFVTLVRTGEERDVEGILLTF